MKPVFWGAFLGVVTTTAGCVDGIDCITVKLLRRMIVMFLTVKIRGSKRQLLPQSSNRGQAN